MNIRTIIGAVLVLLGAGLFLNGGDAIGPGRLLGYFWPTLFVIPLGLFLHWLYFYLTGRKGAGLLIPGGILITSGIVCQIAMLMDNWVYMWPGFIFAVAVGLFEFYWFGGRNKWLMIPISILSVLSLLFFSVFSIGALFAGIGGQPIVAVIIILAGAWLLVGRGKRKIDF
ncbi:hypothetical protein AB6A23_26255 [Paenibacillus tarimensis]